MLHNLHRLHRYHASYQRLAIPWPSCSMLHGRLAKNTTRSLGPSRRMNAAWIPPTAGFAVRPEPNTPRRPNTTDEDDEDVWDEAACPPDAHRSRPPLGPGAPKIRLGPHPRLSRPRSGLTMPSPGHAVLQQAFRRQHVALSVVPDEHDGVSPGPPTHVHA